MIHHLTIPQAMSIWGEFVEAYHKVHSFGTDTAEIYLYRAAPPTVTGYVNADPELNDQARRALYDIAKMFEEAYDATVVVYAGPDKNLPLEHLINAPVDHIGRRVHLMVIRK